MRHIVACAPDSVVLLQSFQPFADGVGYPHRHRRSDGFQICHQQFQNVVYVAVGHRQLAACVGLTQVKVRIYEQVSYCRVVMNPETRRRSGGIPKSGFAAIRHGNGQVSVLHHMAQHLYEQSLHRSDSSIHCHPVQEYS